MNTRRNEAVTDFITELEQQQDDDVAEKAAAKSVADYERLKRKAAGIAKELRDTLLENDRLESAISLIQAVEEAHVAPPPWAAPDPNTNAHRAIPTLMLSDLHLDEVVNPDEIEGLNAYDRDIADFRLQRTFEKAIMTTRDLLAGYHYDGFNLLLGGDLISGWIHEELSETNDDTVPGTVAYWLDPLSAGIGMLVEEFGNVHISGVVGNHGRTTRKPRMKKRVRDNIDWLIMRLLMRDFKNNPNVTWNIPESADCMVQIYDTNFLLTHGDQFRGGSGIAGALSPLMIGHARKVRRNMATDNPFDHLVMGHWHTYWSGKGIMVNGSTKGYDEYAMIGNFDFEEPRQAMWLTTPENGVTFSWPLLCSDRKKEGW